MQTALAILGTLLLYGLCQYNIILRWRAQKAAKIGLRGILTQRESSFATRQIQILIFSLVEFHKTQCFFSMAVQVATLIFILKKNSYFSPRDVTALLTVSTVGTVSVVLNLYALMRYGKSSWYVFCLSLCSWVPSLAVVLNRTLSDMSYQLWDDPRRYAREPLGPDSCGSVPIAALCADLFVEMVQVTS